MATKPFLMGAEVEYSMSNSRVEHRSRLLHLHEWMLEAIRTEHHWLQDAHTATGIYLDNGSRYYLDTGYHNEFSSPELTTPRQIAVYDRAAERILLRAKASVRARRGWDIGITKNNVNFGLSDGAAWGQHEAYTCWIPLMAAAAPLIPHLVSRIPYAGSGCLSGHPHGMGFELSQRARHMTCVTGEQTTHARAIFCTRASKPRDTSTSGWTRTNLISKDSQRCSFGMYLSYGVTGLLFMILNEGHPIGGRMQLQDPVAAMRTFSLDPTLRVRVPLAQGGEATAIDIQRDYWSETRPYVESGHFPDWTSEVWEHWGTTLDRLETNPFQLATRLDTYLKLAILDRQLQRASMSWSTLHRALRVLEELRRCAPEPWVRAVLDGTHHRLGRKGQDLYDRLGLPTTLRETGLDSLRFAVRLQALELNYHELGGLFDQMSAAGQIDAVVATPEEIEHAVHNPPPGGRAKIRSECIAEYQGEPWLCDWSYVVRHDKQEWVDLREPFSLTRKRRSSASRNRLFGRPRPPFAQ